MGKMLLNQYYRWFPITEPLLLIHAKNKIIEITTDDDDDDDENDDDDDDDDDDGDDE
eukprot:Awhi_evm1s10866